MFMFMFMFMIMFVFVFVIVIVYGRSVPPTTPLNAMSPPVPAFRV